ncbi:MAG: thioesterase family protein [Caulobacteraceae bacterium]|nr:thioesterase family protein [Caulobacteraceae bacterium]
MALIYDKQGEEFLAQAPAVGPWDPASQSGVTLAGLMAHAAETTPCQPGMDLARFHLDILRPVAMAKPIRIERAFVRDGRRLQVVDLSLTSDGELAARATAVRLRLRETPDLAPPTTPIDPETLDAPSMSQRRAMRGLITSRLLRGGIENLGPGDAWFRFEADIAPGAPITPFVTAAMVSDIGSGLSSVVDWRTYTFSNIDISINLTRAPRDPWIRVQAETLTHGGGRALVNTTLSDRFGPFAQAHQTLFIDPRG